MADFRQPDFEVKGSRAGNKSHHKYPSNPWFLLEEFGSLQDLTPGRRALQTTPQPPLSSGSIRGVWEL